MTEKRQRITKKEYDKLGGFAHSDITMKIFRIYNDKHWVYYKTTYTFKQKEKWQLLLTNYVNTALHKAI